MKKLGYVSVIFVLIIALSGCSILSFTPKDKTFTKSGMTITLTDKFYEKEVRSYTATYESSNVAVFALKEEFSLAAGLEDYTLKEYAQLVIDNNGKDCEITEEDNLTYFVFDNSSNGKDYRYFSCVYKSADSFWLIQFSTVADKYDDNKDDIIKWAKSVAV